MRSSSTSTTWSMIRVWASWTEEKSVGLALIMEKAVDDLGAAAGRQVDRQALAAEMLADLFQHRLGIRVPRVDLVDDDDPAQAAVAGRVHHSLRHCLDAGDGAHHDGGGLDRFEHRQRAADEVRVARRVDQVNARLAGLQPADRGVDGMLQAARLRIVVGNGGAADQAALGAGRSGLDQKRLGQQGFPGPGVSHQGQVSEVAGCFRHPVPRPVRCRPVFQKE